MTVDWIKCMTFFGFIDKNLEHCYRIYGRIAAQYPWPLIFIPLIITAVSAIGVPFRNTSTDFIELNVPTNARYYREKEIVDYQWPSIENYYNPNRVTDIKLLFQVIIEPAIHGDNILEPKYAEEVQNLNDWVVNRIYVFHKGERYQYDNLCYFTFDIACYSNRVIDYINFQFAEEPSMLTFPSYLGAFDLVKMNVAASLGNVSLVVKKDGQVTNQVATASSYLLNYHLNPSRYLGTPNDAQEFAEISKKWLDEFEASVNAYPKNGTNVYVHRWDSYVEDFQNTSKLLQSDFIWAFIILVIFSSLAGIVIMIKPLKVRTSWKDSCLIDWTRSKCALGLLSCITSAMGTTTAIGLLAALGCTWLMNISVLPFLIVAIGVDNMFLLTASWKRYSHVRSLDDRIGETMADAAVSITITALTDFLSFAIACITRIPSVQAFCVHAAIAILITFIYQLTFFIGCMVLTGRAEHNGRHHLFGTKTVPVEQIESPTAVQLICCMRQFNSNEVKHDPTKTKTPTQFFKNWYGPLLNNPFMKICIIIGYTGYLSVAIYGCTQTRNGFDVMGLFNKNSSLYKFQRLWRDEYHDKGLVTQVIINNPPNFTTNPRKAVAKSLEIADSFMDTPFTYGLEGRYFVLDDYNKLLDDASLWLYIEEYDLTYFRVYLRDVYLKAIPSSRYWIDVKFGDLPDDQYNIKALRFELNLKNTASGVNKLEACDLIRSIADTWGTQYNVSVFSQFWLYTDNHRLVVPNTLMNMGIAIAAMFCVSLFFIPHILAAALVGASVVSIAVGVIGFMVLWGIWLDSVSMITLIMSIGFSVDFSAHFCHGFVRCAATDAGERICIVLGKLGWPILQGAISSILGVLVLGFIDIYMVQVFFTNIFLVILIGSLHSLVFLPVALGLIVRGSHLQFVETGGTETTAKY